jgi:hypothetical protein
MFTPMRSFTELHGLKNSSLQSKVASIPAEILLSLTIGVLPISSVTSLAIPLRSIVSPKIARRDASTPTYLGRSPTPTEKFYQSLKADMALTMHEYHRFIKHALTSPLRIRVK